MLGLASSASRKFYLKLGDNVEKEKLDEYKTNKEEEEVDKLYSDVNINLEGRDTKMTDASLANVQTTQVIEDTYVIMTYVPLEVQQQNVPVTTNLEMPPSSVTPLPSPPIPLIQPHQQTPSDKLRDEAQAENEDFINKLDENIKKIIKEQVKVQVKERVTKILPRIKKLVNEQLEAEVLTHSSNEAKTSHTVAANLSELELKIILIDKIERNKSIHRSDQQETLYKALINAYETDKVILDTYGDTATIKRRRDDEDDDEEPSARSNRGSKRSRARKEPESTSSAQVEEPIHTADDLEEATPQEFNTDFSAFMINRLKVDTLTLELLVGLTFKVMKGSCKSLMELEYFLEEVYKATTDQLDWNKPKGRQYPHDLHKPLPLIPNSQGRRVIPFDHFINNDLVYLRGGTSAELMQLQTSSSECFIINVYKKYCHPKGVEDLQLGVESYQKKLNLTRPDTYKSNLKRLPTYSAYSNPRGFIYQNKEKKNRLMCIDELHKFSDGILNDVRTALDDILKRIKMKYLPQTY
nr:hypothetical protein [Tanacetum cinerariifolium]